MNTLELIREELKDISGLKKREQLFCLSGIIRAIGEIQIAEGKVALLLSSESGAAIMTAVALLKSVFNVEVELGSRPSQIRKNRCLEVSVYSEEAIKVLNETSVLNDDGISENVPDTLDDSELSAYFKGLFLGSGTLCIPESEKSGGYHLEMSVFSENLANNIINIFAKKDIEFKLIEKKMQVLYLKDSEQIGSFCAFIGASETALKAYLIKTEREMRGKVNRDNNCAVYNMDKTALASVRQLQAIDIIETSEGGLTKLTAPLIEIAKIRRENPEATLEELSLLLSDKPSKSGVNHRLRKLVEIAKDITDKNTED